MQLIYLNKRTKIEKYKGKEVLNLCIYGSFEKYFDVNLTEYFKIIDPKKSLKFKDKYLEKIDAIAFELVGNISNDKLAQVLSYRTFSKLAVSDNLVDKFWIIEQLRLFKNSDIIIFIDDFDIYNLYSFGRLKYTFSEILPYKLIYYFIIFLYNKIRVSKYIAKSNIDINFNLYVGNNFEIKKNHDSIYEDYFFSKYWKNQPNSFLLLNIGEWNSKVEIEKEILFKESFLSFNDIFRLLFISLKHFYNPIQILEESIEDCLVNRNLRTDVKSGSFIDAYQNYFIYSKLLKFLINKKGKLIIPHEGRSYERIICTIFENTLINVIGYAHFPVSERILNYYYGKLENIIYNKFTFYTLSETNYNHFKNLYKWPNTKFKIGAHLKAKPLKTISLSIRKYDILILLGNELIQNIKLLTFVKNSLKNENYKILVRIHPSSRGLDYLEHLFLKYNFFRINQNSLLEDVELSKIIVYGDTGAAIDCLNYNVPLCYINDDNCLLSDRLNDSIDGHYRFYDTNVFSLALPSLLKNNLNISFESFIPKYISPINPKLFFFD
jgi:hypothetical protein